MVVRYYSLTFANNHGSGYASGLVYQNLKWATSPSTG
jgi:hypothetical protein